MRRLLSTSLLLLAACASGSTRPDEPTGADSATAATSEPTAEPSATAAPSASAPVAGATASASATAGAPVSEVETFWIELGKVFNAKVPECATGWTGDGRITIKDGKIAKFEIVERDPKGDRARAVPGLKGTVVPPIPAPLKKEFEKPVDVTVCFSSARLSNG